MTYSESARGQWIGANRVEQEIRKHGHGQNMILVTCWHGLATEWETIK